MAEQNTDSEKSFEPTPRKLQEARRKGDVPKSTDLNATAAYVGLFIALVLSAPGTMLSAADGMSVFLDQAAQLTPLFFDGPAVAPFGQALTQSLGFLATVFLVPIGAVIASAIAQQSVTFAPSKLAPKLSKISPISNAKQKYGPSGLFEFLKSFVKLAVFTICLALFFHAEIAAIITTPFLEPRISISYLGELFLSFLAIVIAVSAAVGAVDFLFQYFEHRRKLRMTRKEMTDETKESEGDPFIKQERRQRGRDIAMAQTLQEVETADVVITNPTHYAVALRWSRLPGSAPVCVSKGIDEFARAIRERAAEHSVPVHADPPTARALHATTEIGAEIPQDQYRAVATAIRFAETMRQKMRTRGY